MHVVKWIILMEETETLLDFIFRYLSDKPNQPQSLCLKKKERKKEKERRGGGRTFIEKLL